MHREKNIPFNREKMVKCPKFEFTIFFLFLKGDCYEGK